MENNYSVYQHVTPDGMYYFGQSQNVEKRWECNGIHYKTTSLYPYIEKFGWENIQHIILFENKTKEDALWIENFLIETAREDGVCINQQRSGLVSKEEGYKREYNREYYEQNRDKYNEYHREYREKNRDKIREQNREYNREYYEQNREKILEQQRKYQQKNKDKIREYKRQWYQQKKLEKQLKEVETTPLF